MRQKIKGEYFDSAFLLNSLFVWLITSMVLLIIFAIILNETGANEKAIAYSSSAISFLSAMAAGITAAKKRKAGTLYTALLTGTVLVTSLLTVGFMINGPDIDPAAVLSVVSFSFTGCMVGSVLFFSPSAKRKKYKPRI